MQQPIDENESKNNNNNNNNNNKKEEEKSKKPPAGKSKRIRLFPNKTQKATLVKWMGAARWTFNQCLAAVESKEEPAPRNKKALRAKFVNNDVFKEDKERKWVLETPYDVRDEGMNDLLKAYQTNFAKRKKQGPSHTFKIQFRSKKSDSQSIVIHSKHWKSIGVFYPTFFGKDPIRASEPPTQQVAVRLSTTKDAIGRVLLVFATATGCEKG